MKKVCTDLSTGLVAIAAVLAAQSAAAQAPGSSLGSPRTALSPNLPAPPLLAPSAPPVANPTGRTVPAARPSPSSITQIQQPAAAPMPMPPNAKASAPGGNRRLASPSKLSSTPLVLLSPRRADLLKQQQRLRAQEDLQAQQARTGPTAVGTVGSAKSAAELLKPGIRTINRKASGAVATPGGLLTISGRGFGDTTGEAALVGKFSSGKVTLLPVQWGDGEIVVRVPDGLRGVEDQQATLTVAPLSGQLLRQDQLRFVAVKEEITIPESAVSRVVDLLPDAGWKAGVVGGAVRRADGGRKLVCAKPGTDVLRFRALKPGWEVVGISMQHGRTDSGDGGANGSGSRTFFPAYGLGPWSDQQLEVRWGVWRSHDSPVGGISGEDYCESIYQLTIRAFGPAGLLPY